MSVRYGTRLAHASPLYVFKHRAKPDVFALANRRGAVPSGCMDVLLFLLTRPVQWRTSDRLIADHHGLGLWAARKRLGALVEAGFLKKISVKHGGRFMWIWAVTEDPVRLPLDERRLGRCRAHATGADGDDPSYVPRVPRATPVVAAVPVAEDTMSADLARSEVDVPDVDDHIFSKENLGEIYTSARKETTKVNVPGSGRLRPPLRFRERERRSPSMSPRWEKALDVINTLGVAADPWTLRVCAELLRSATVTQLVHQISIGFSRRVVIPRRSVIERLCALSGENPPPSLTDCDDVTTPGGV